MKPSDIIIDAMPPLTACFKKTESECAAALLVWYCQNHGDEWQTVTPKQLGEAMMDMNSEPLKKWSRNPFFKPDLWRLSKDGFITPIDDSYNQPVAFTELGLEQLRKSLWNRKRL